MCALLPTRILVRYSEEKYTNYFPHNDQAPSHSNRGKKIDP